MGRQSHAWKVLLLVNIVMSMLLFLIVSAYPVGRLGSGFAYARPVIFAGMTIIWAGTFYAGYSAHRKRLGSRREAECVESFWDSFVSKPSNWAAMIAGAALLSLEALAQFSYSAAASPMPSHSAASGWLGSLGFLLMAYGLYLGIFISLNEYRKKLRALPC